MPKQFISKHLPKASTVTKHRSLRWLGSILHDSNLWHLNRRSVASAVFAGIFACFLPIPMQMVLAAGFAIFLHGNLPLAIALTWISNPLTYAPIYYLCYRFGLVLLGQPHDPASLEWSVNSMGDNLAQVIVPLMTGCLVAGTAFGATGYFIVRLIWRFHVQHTWFKRKAERAKQMSARIKQNLKEKRGAQSIDEKLSQKTHAQKKEADQ